ncbi:GntR family transcriptional regulator [Aurantimonas endophytica]|uniref:GntR family transcriptional regulator n=1 Tax=Aurantimonas endophytica TaxID=1522175 RepID=UPI001FE7C791|nr:GntR family transcriptional regulator [Aurantimonas endophytica]
MVTAIQRNPAPVRGQVEVYLRSEIEIGNLRPGDRIVERTVCEALDVSRPLVREALRSLQSEGLVRALPRGGIEVTSLSPEEAGHIYTVRKELEGLSALLFVANATADDREMLYRAVSDLKAAFEANEAERLLEAKNRFYAILSAGSGNPVLQAMLRNIHGQIRLLRGTSLSEPGRAGRMVGELSAIVEAVRKGDAQEARRLTEAHVAAAMDATKQALSDRKDKRVAAE